MHAILTYHSLDDSGSPISLSPEAFARHVAFLARGSVEVLPLARLLEAPWDGRRRVALTFDDGFRNFVDHAWPTLREHGFPATVYVVAGHVGGTNLWGGVAHPSIPTLPLMTWEELARLHGDGLELGIHGRTHTALRKRPAAFVEEEIESTRASILERTGAMATAFAYPYGSYDAVSLAVARRSTASAVTTDMAMLRPRADVHRLPRLDAYYFGRVGLLESFGTMPFRAFVARRAALRRVRALARGALRLVSREEEAP